MPEYDGRFELEWRYTVDVVGRLLTHRHTYDVAVVGDPEPGTAFEDIDLTRRDTSVVTLDAWCTTYAALIDPFFGSGTAYEEVILWRYGDEPSLSKIYISSWASIPTIVGAGDPVPAQGMIFTMRVAGYQYPMRMYFMEAGYPGEGRINYEGLDTPQTSYVNAVIGEGSPIVGRVDDYPIAFIALNLGQNEKLRRKRYRDE